MGTQSLLVRIPGHPFTIETLAPDMGLMGLASALYSAGHEARVVDFGNVKTFERLYPLELRGSVSQLAETIYSSEIDHGLRATASLRLKLRRFHRIIEDHHLRAQSELAHEIAAAGPSDSVVFKLAGRKDLAPAISVAETLRTLQDGTPLIAWWPGLSENDKAAVELASKFDCVYLSPDESGLLELADVLDRPSCWKGIEGLLQRSGRRILYRRRTEHEGNVGIADPSAAVEAYTDLTSTSKIKLFPLDAGQFPFQETPESVSRVRLHGANPLVRQVSRLKSAFGPCAFYFDSAADSSFAPQTLARDLLSARIQITYAVRAPVHMVSPASLTTLKVSGCRVLSLQIHTGSQRLLDRHYRTPTSVTDIENLVKSSKFSNIFTHTRFTYPCVEDDYHTKDETLRMISRVIPDALSIDLPVPAATQFRRHAANMNRAGSASDFSPTHLGRDQEMKRNGEYSRAELAEHAEMLMAVGELGVPTIVTPERALMADLAGYRGRESEFVQRLRYQLLTGDAIGVATMVELINGGAEGGSQGRELRPFTAVQNAVGN